MENGGDSTLSNGCHGTLGGERLGAGYGALLVQISVDAQMTSNVGVALQHVVVTTT